jgi:hypothetical protein
MRWNLSVDEIHKALLLLRCIIDWIR